MQNNRRFQERIQGTLPGSPGYLPVLDNSSQTRSCCHSPPSLSKVSSLGCFLTYQNMAFSTHTLVPSTIEVEQLQVCKESNCSLTLPGARAPGAPSCIRPWISLVLNSYTHAGYPTFSSLDTTMWARGLIIVCTKMWRVFFLQWSPPSCRTVSSKALQSRQLRTLFVLCACCCTQSRVLYTCIHSTWYNRWSCVYLVKGLAMAMAMSRLYLQQPF